MTYSRCKFRSVWLVLFCMGLAVFMLSCGDEGDSVDEEPVGVTDIVQPVTTPPPTPEPPVSPPVVVVEEPVVVEPPPPPVIAEPKVSFQEDISPILEARCAIPGCHAAGGAAARLDLSQYDTFKNGGNNGPAFVAGDGEGSLVVKRIDGGGMPPIPPPLTDEEIRLFIDWIDEGAEDN